MKYILCFFLLFNSLLAMESNSPITISTSSSSMDSSFADMIIRQYELRHGANFSTHIKPYVIQVVQEASSPLAPEEPRERILRIRSGEVQFPNHDEVLEALATQAVHRAFLDHYKLQEMYKKKYEGKWSKRKIVVVNTTITSVCSLIVGLSVYFGK